jgi:hypothetical protein
LPWAPGAPAAFRSFFSAAWLTERSSRRRCPCSSCGDGESQLAIGNLIGGTFLVGVVYWFVYLLPRLKD